MYSLDFSLYFVVYFSGSEVSCLLAAQEMVGSGSPVATALNIAVLPGKKKHNKTIKNEQLA